MVSEIDEEARCSRFYKPSARCLPLDLQRARGRRNARLVSSLFRGCRSAAFWTNHPRSYNLSKQKKFERCGSPHRKDAEPSASCPGSR